MSIKISNLSHTSISQYATCPRSWAARYMEGTVETRGDAARFGDSFDKLIGEELGFPVNEYTNDEGKKTKCEPGFYRAKYSTPEVESAVKHYFAQKWAWKSAHAVQVFIEITPNRWAEIAQRYGANPCLPDRLIGFIDLLRHTPESEELDDYLRPVEIVDLKTIGQDVWKDEWARQCVLYALATNAARWSIHRFVRGSANKLACRSFDMAGEGMQRLCREVMDHTVYYAEQIVKLRKEEGLIEHLPRHAGYHCRWCPLRTTCVSGSVFEAGTLPGKFQWAKGELEDTNHGCSGGDITSMIQGINL